MKTTIQHYVFLSLLFTLCSFFSQAQDYEWDWAKNGGGNLQMLSETANVFNNFNAESIRDIVTDEDNNYYFLGKISHSNSAVNSHVDGNEVTTFGSGTQGSHNILITSFTCEGVYRWSRIIGGGG